MAKEKGPTAEDRATAIGVALAGIAGGVELGEIAARLAPLHPKNNTFPGEVLLGLAADAIEESGASREQPLEFEGIRTRHLPKDPGPHEGPAPQGRVRAAGGGDGPGRGRSRGARRGELVAHR
jgi:hypothetical protein